MVGRPLHGASEAIEGSPPYWPAWFHRVACAISVHSDVYGLLESRDLKVYNQRRWTLLQCCFLLSLLHLLSALQDVTNWSYLCRWVRHWLQKDKAWHHHDCRSGQTYSSQYKDIKMTFVVKREDA